jgi:IclR family acetate operon transcriptional repressor
MISEVFAPAMTAMAAPALRDARTVVGVISIAGPKVRLTEKRMTELGPALLDVAAEFAAASRASTHFRDLPLRRL